jgi:ABC-type transporter Mla subunit MlaD
MTDESPSDRIDALSRSIVTLEQEIQELKGHLRHQGELNQKLASAFSKSAETTAIINETQTKLARRQGLFLMILTGQLRGGVPELKALLQAIAANPETPASFAEAAADLDAEIQVWTSGQDQARWIPEIVGGTDVEDPS